LEGMSERTITISGASKSFSVTGWRIGTIVAPPDATDAIRKVHDFLTVGAPAPLQEAVAVGLEILGDEYYERLAHEYRARRALLGGPARSVAAEPPPPFGGGGSRPAGMNSPLPNGPFKNRSRRSAWGWVRCSVRARATTAASRAAPATTANAEGTPATPASPGIRSSAATTPAAAATHT